MNKTRKNLLLYGLVMLLVLALTGAAWAIPADTTSSEQESSEPQTTSVFKDVQAGDNNLIYINYLAKREIISGFPDGGFHPNEGLSRAQAATLLVKAAGLSSSDKKAVFKDVNEGHWAAGSITAAANAGYLKGYPDGNYHPEEKLTRAQGISLVLRLSKQKDTGVELPSLKDLDSQHWAARSAAIGLAADMVGLTSDKTQFLPDTEFSRGDLTRALAILMTTDPDLNQVPLNGSLEIKLGGVKVNDQAVTGNVSIKAGDKITTAAKAEAQLTYPDGSGLLIKENSQLTVKETRGRAYIKKDGSPGTSVDWLLVDVKKGDIFGALATNPNVKEEKSEKKTASLGEKLLAGISGTLQYLAAEEKAAPWYKTAEAKKVKVKVDMPYGVAAIRGSFWNNIVNANGSGSTSLLEGDASLTSGGQSINLPPGQSSGGAPGGAPPTPPAPMTPAQVGLWVQQATWLQNVVQNMQQNQEAPRTEAGITQTPAPGQPAPPAPPALPNIMNQINQALNQVMQNAGFNNPIDLNNLPDSLESYIPPNPNPGPGPNNQEFDSGPSPSTVLANLVNTPAYMQVNSITVSGSSLSLSGKTYPGNSVRLGGMLLQNPAANTIATADAYGNFIFSNVSIYSSAAPESADLVLDQLLDSTGNSMVKASLFIPNVLNSPSLPAMLKINRGLYTDDSTPVTITGQILPAQGQVVQIKLIGAEPEQEPWTGTAAADGSFSIPIGLQAPGTQLGVFTNPPANPITPVTSGGGHTYVYAANAVGVMATLPQNGGILGSNTVQVFFDRSVDAGSNFESITLSPSGNYTIAGAISGSFLTITVTGTLEANTRYTVSIPDGAVQDANNPEVILTQAFSFGFSTPQALGAGWLEGFETGSLPGWITDGLWNVIDNSSGIKNGAVSQYVQLPSGDTSAGLLPSTPYGSNCLWYGKTASSNPYEVGNYLNVQAVGDSDNSGGFSAAPHSGSAITPAITLPASGTPTLSFKSWWEIESVNPAAFDMMTIHILDANGTELAQLPRINPSSASGGSPAVAYTSAGQNLPGVWQDYSFPLTSYLGQSIRIMFQFNTGDHKYNGFRGWFIDEVQVLPQAPTIGIQSVIATPNPIQPSSSEQLVNIDISSSGLADGTAVTVQLYIPGTTPDPLGDPVSPIISANAATAVLTIPAETPEGWYIIRASSSDFSVDVPFLISNWMSMADGSFEPATSCSTTALGVDYNGDAYAAYVNAGMTPVVKKHSGSSWSNWGPTPVNANSGYADLAVSDQAYTGNAFLAYKDNNNKASVMSKMYYESSTDPWTDLGIVSGDSVERFSVTSGENKPYPACYSTDSSSIQAYVYESGGWANLGSPGGSNAGELSLGWNAYKPYLAFSNTSNTVYMYVYDSNNWTLYGGSPVSSDAATNTAVSLAIDDSGNPYVAYRDSGGNVMVKMYCDSLWSTVGNTVGTSTANYVSLALDGDNVPYIIYSDTSLTGPDAGKATVKYCSGDLWETVGFAGFSPTVVSEPRIKIIGSNLYVIYKDADNNIKVMQRTLELP